MKILIVELAYVGDTLLTTPFIRAVKETHPEAQLDFLASEYSAEILNTNPHLGRIWRWKRTADLSDFLEWVRFLRREQYDRAYVLHRSLRAVLWAYFAQIRQRYGYSTTFGRWFLTKCVAYKLEEHRADNHLRLFSAIHRKPVSERRLELIIPEEVQNEVKKWIPEGAYFVVHPAGSWESKNWTTEGYAQVAEFLYEKYGWNAVFTGWEKDREVVEQVQSKMRHPGRNLVGKTTVMQLGGVIQRAKCVLTNDSGPMHISVALDVPTFAFFGPTSPQRSGPIGDNARVFFAGVPCSPCYKKICPPRFAHRCMTTISPQTVQSFIKNFFTKGRE